MFLPMTERRNPALIEAAIALHRSGRIEPDTYVLDRDAIARNSAALAAAAEKHRIGLWFVAKQYGRNPLVTETVSRHIHAAAAIDHREAEAVLTGGARLGNVGHLVQIPRRALPGLLAHAPDHVTVFDPENLDALADAAARLGRRQRALLRIRGSQESTFPGQDGGFEVDQLDATVKHAGSLPGIEVAGATGFPCISFDTRSRLPRPTGTMEHVQAAAAKLRELGIDPVLSLPSHTSVSTIPQIAAAGGTFGEPGHALTGTTPQHAHEPELAEQPAMVYVSEIAQLGTAPSVFGGGFYSRGHARNLIVATADGVRHARLRSAPAASIDYYRRFDWHAEGVRAGVGDTAVMAFRTQVFVTRSRVAVASGVGTGQTVIDGIFDALGRRIA